MTPIISLARFQSTEGQANKAHGVYLAATLVMAITNVGYSIRDTLGALNALTPPTFTNWESRLAVLIGKFGGNVEDFTTTFDLSQYQVALDTALTTSTGALGFASDQTPLQSKYGQGISILIASPALFGSGVPAVNCFCRLYGSTGAPPQSQQFVGAGGAVGGGGGGAGGGAGGGGGTGGGGPISGGGGGGGFQHGGIQREPL